MCVQGDTTDKHAHRRYARIVAVNRQAMEAAIQQLVHVNANQVMVGTAAERRSVSLNVDLMESAIWSS